MTPPHHHGDQQILIWPASCHGSNGKALVAPPSPLQQWQAACLTYRNTQTLGNIEATLREALYGTTLKDRMLAAYMRVQHHQQSFLQKAL